jgi:hypothetical protein
MKCTNIIALIMVLLGVIMITYATTRYWTTKHVLTAAQDRMNSALKSHGLHEHVYAYESSDPPRIALAIPLAGGMYYWWNKAIPYWAAGFVLVFSGLAVTRYRPKKLMANKPAHPTGG